MQSLNFPEYKFTIKTEEQRNYIFDNIRKRYVFLTPEEWVRQNLISYLVEEKKYPASLIAVEMPLRINRLERRADIVLFSREGKPLVIAECKSPDIKISQKAFDQAARYNMDMKVAFLIVSNGMVHYCAKLDHALGTWEFLNEIPMFPPGDMGISK
jgi:predicted type IV restriction endonuclease